METDREAGDKPQIPAWEPTKIPVEVRRDALRRAGALAQDTVTVVITGPPEEDLVSDQRVGLEPGDEIQKEGPNEISRRGFILAGGVAVIGALVGLIAHDNSEKKGNPNHDADRDKASQPPVTEAKQEFFKLGTSVKVPQEREAFTSGPRMNNLLLEVKEAQTVNEVEEIIAKTLRELHIKFRIGINTNRIKSSQVKDSPEQLTKNLLLASISATHLLESMAEVPIGLLPHPGSIIYATTGYEYNTWGGNKDFEPSTGMYFGGYNDDKSISVIGFGKEEDTREITRWALAWDLVYHSGLTASEEYQKVAEVLLAGNNSLYPDIHLGSLDQNSVFTFSDTPEGDQLKELIEGLIKNNPAIDRAQVLSLLAPPSFNFDD